MHGNQPETHSKAVYLFVTRHCDDADIILTGVLTNFASKGVQVGSMQAQWVVKAHRVSGSNRVARQDAASHNAARIAGQMYLDAIGM